LITIILFVGKFFFGNHLKWIKAANIDNSYDSKTRGEAALLSLGFLSNSLRNVSQISESKEIIYRIINHLNSSEDQRN